LELIESWIWKLRGMLSFGVLGSVVGATIITIWMVGKVVLTGEWLGMDGLAFFSILGASIGAACGTSFSAMIAGFDSETTLSEVPV
jgi:hypothetical protein